MNYKLNITFRSIAAIFGSYGLAVASSFALVPVFMHVFDCFKADAVYLGTIFSYVFYFLCVIFCFSRACVWLVWRDIAIVSFAFYLIHFLGN